MSEPDDIEADIELMITMQLQSLSIFHQACDNVALGDKKIKEIQKELQIESDIPTAFIGLCHSLSCEEPQYYFNKDVMNEVSEKLEKSKNLDENKFLKSIAKSQEPFFMAINSYINIIEIYKDLSETAYETEFKTKIFRNPLYIQTCEDCLMNFYRCFLEILSAETGKNYTEQNTLGKAIPVLRKFKLNKSTEIDTNIRNAINHGNTISYDERILFKYSEKGNYKTKEINVWDYDKLINEVVDIAGGVLAGFLKFYSKQPTFIIDLFSSEISENDKFEWYKLFYNAPNTKVIFVTKNESPKKQLNITVQTSILDKNKLYMALIEIAKGAFFQFSTFERYFVGYRHNRSIGGYLSFSVADFEAMENSDSDNANLLEKAIEKSEVLVWDIQNEKIDERAYKFHLFPNISNDKWHLSKISDCSVDKSKRLKANLILDGKSSKPTVKIAVTEAISKMKNLRTPQNPHVDVPWGELESDAIFLNVFIKNNKRKGFDLLPSNPKFVCLVHYYKTKEVPKLKHGGVPLSIWNEYKKEKTKQIEFAWNPRLITKRKKVKGLTA